MQSIWQPLAAIAGALPCFLMAHHFLRVWRYPETVEQGRWVGFGIHVLVMEFLVIHSAVFMVVMAGHSNIKVKILGIAGLLIFYGFFVAGLAYISKSPALLKMFFTIMAGRMVAIVWATATGALEFLQYRSFISVALYILVIPLPLPAWGLADPKWADALRKDGSSGLWIDKPHRAIGAATIYFFLVGLAELFLLSWVPLR